jgi:hypothetical protein
MYASPPILGTWDVGGRVTASTGATAFALGLIPPFMGGPGRMRRTWNFASSEGISKATLNSGIIHVDKLVALTGATAEQFTFMRPLNFSYNTVNSLVASSHTRLTLPNDPAYWGAAVGTYPWGTGTYAYDQILPASGVVVGTTNALWPPTAQSKTNAMAAGDYVCTQLADGTWILDTVLSGWASTFTSGVPTTGSTGTVDLTSNYPAGSILAGAPFYYFGPLTAASAAFASQYFDPATGALPPIFNFAASSGPTLLDMSPYGGGNFGICSTLHMGDPLMFALTELTNQAYIETLSGWYSKW